MRIIKSIQNQSIKDIAKLKEKKYRDMTSLFIIEGEHLVRMAKEAGSLETILVDEDALEKYLDLIDEENTIIVNEAIVNKLS
jgi:TrmH family RNA methyltransferase